MRPTDKIKPTDKFYTVDKTPFDFQSIGGRQRFNVNSTYQALMNRGAYVLIVEDYDKVTHKQDGSMTFDVDHFNAGIAELTASEIAEKEMQEVLAAWPALDQYMHRSMESNITTGAQSLSNMDPFLVDVYEKRVKLRAIQDALSDKVKTEEEMTALGTTVGGFRSFLTNTLNGIGEWF